MAWSFAIFAVVLAAELIGAYIVVYKGGHIMNDALARTANAYYVLYILPSKLASIGFVWNPLPSLLQIPILVFAQFWRPLATHGLAGSILTAIFAGINAGLLFRYFRLCGTGVKLSLLIAALWAFNPFIFFYGLNGMSETIFFTVILSGVFNFAMWMEDRNTNRLLIVALMMAMGFLTRYEILTMMVAFAASLLVIIYLMRDKASPFPTKPFGMGLSYTVSTFIVLFLPVVYIIAIWAIVNWTIMGDPFYFLGSAYSNEAQAAVGLADSLRFRDSKYAALLAFGYMSVRSLPFIAPLIVIVIERIFTRRLFKMDMVVFILLAGCFLGFHYVLLLTGKSFGWLRFFCYVMPVCLAWLPYEMLKLKNRARIASIVFLCIGLVVSAGMIPYYFSNYTLGSEEYPILFQPESERTNPQVALAQLLNEQHRDATILMDSFLTSSLIVNLENSENIITNTSDEFLAAIHDPHAYHVDFIVVPRPRGIGLLDTINDAYPDLFYYGVPSWAEFVAGNDMYRLYKVTPIEDEDEPEEETRHSMQNSITSVDIGS